MVSGSLIEGLGNRRSDLDFFVLSERYPRDVPVRMAFAGDSWVDIEYVPPAAVGDLARRLGEIDPKNLAQVLQLTHKELDRYYRLAIGVTVKGANPFSRMLSLDVFQGLLEPWALLHAGAYAARAAIALGNGDPTAAVLYASHAAHLCVESALAKVGELYPSLKYTHEKAVRAYGAGSAEAGQVAVLLRPAHDLERYVVEVIEHVEGALAGCLSTSDSGDLPVAPVTPLAHHRHPAMTTLMTRKSAYDLVPEDTATVGALLGLPDLAGYERAPVPYPWLADAHRLVLRVAMVDLGILVTTEALGAR